MRHLACVFVVSSFLAASVNAETVVHYAGNHGTQAGCNSCQSDLSGLGGCCPRDVSYAASLWSNYCADRHPEGSHLLGGCLAGGCRGAHCGPRFLGSACGTGGCCGAAGCDVTSHGACCDNAAAGCATAPLPDGLQLEESPASDASPDAPLPPALPEVDEPADVAVPEDGPPIAPPAPGESARRWRNPLLFFQRL